ncbi:MAG: antibiotic biosynthesis monooxygenase [Dehalococcoidia bacterium]|nr:antibiotic biosynthesis monooxygenase [Dehalococcoidia bacterium]
MIALIAKLTALDGKETEMKSALEKMVAAVDQTEPDVSHYELHVSNENPCEFYFYERYENAEAQNAHRTTKHMRQLGQTLKDITGAKPEITQLTWLAGVNRN